MSGTIIVHVYRPRSHSMVSPFKAKNTAYTSKDPLGDRAHGQSKRVVLQWALCGVTVVACAIDSC